MRWQTRKDAKWQQEQCGCGTEFPEFPFPNFHSDYYRYGILAQASYVNVPGPSCSDALAFRAATPMRNAFLEVRMAAPDSPPCIEPQRQGVAHSKWRTGTSIGDLRCG